MFSTEAAKDQEDENEADFGGGSLLGWVKGRGGGLMAKVQSSMETVITTLDPQMKDYIKSGGQTCIVVASDKGYNNVYLFLYS